MPAGQPRFFETPEELQTKVDEYFELCKYEVIKDAVSGEEVMKGDTITISGLALYLGFESRQSFYDYEKLPEFSYIIKKARFKVECSYEKRLDSRNPTGAIFALKNMGWKDKQEVESTVKDERIDESKLSTDDLRVLAEIQRRGRTGSEGVRWFYRLH